jgi:transcriptional regulator with XRE-family HTH domain
MNETFLPGVTLLRQWLTEHGLSQRRFALDHGLDQADLSKILRGKRGVVSIEFAFKIEKATSGNINAREWIPKKKNQQENV